MTLHPAEPQPSLAEAPVHLRGALRAAAAARDRATRIRTGEPGSSPVSERPRQSGRSAPPSKQQRSDRLRFARTVAAAQQTRASLPDRGEDVPLHLRLREDENQGADRARWLSRLLEPLRARLKPVPDLLSLPYSPAPKAPDAAQIPELHWTKVLNQVDRGLPANSARLAFERPTSIGSVGLAPAEGAPAPAETLRLPPLGGRRFHAGDPLRGLAQDPIGDHDPAGLASRQTTEAAGKLGSPPPLEPPAEAGGPARWRWPTDYPAPSGLAQAALATRWRSRSQGVAADVVPTEQARFHLPVPLKAPGLPASRLAHVLAGPRQTTDGRPRGGARSATRPATPPAAAPASALRSRARLLTLSVAVAAGCVLGIVAYNSAPLSSARLGQAVLALDPGWLEGSNGARSEAAVPDQIAEPGQMAPPPSSVLALPAANDRLDQRPERDASADSLGAAVSAAAPAPAEINDGPASTGRDGLASDQATTKGARDPAASAGAAMEQAMALAATAAPRWESLYSSGHRFQLQGNLVAAADAYRRAIELNPHHPSMLYDLGYVLQMQGRIEAAIDLYRQAIALQPDHAYAHYNLAHLLQVQGQSTAAVEHYEIAAARLPGNPYIYYGWAWSLESSGDRAGAAALYRKAIEIDPQTRPGIDARRRLAALGEQARLQ